MLSFKQFIAIQEALNIDQKNYLKIYDNPDPNENTKKLSEKLFPEGNDTVRLPITFDTQARIKSHLEKHGYTIKNYKNGTAYKTNDPKQQLKSIGSILKDKKTEATPELISGFENDSRKPESEISPETHDILLSRVPEHVGECGTNKKWKTSCVKITPSGRPTTYGKGAAAKKLGYSIKAGTHVAYLMKKDSKGQVETNPEKAQARILLHPYHAYDKDGNIIHSVIMPERKVYTVGGYPKRSAFHNTLEDYIKEKSPMKPGLIYYKDSGVYDDDGQKIRYNTSPDSVKKMLLSKDVREHDKTEAIKSTKLNNAAISSILNEPKTDDNSISLNDSHNLIAKHQKLSDTNFDHLLKLGHVSSLSQNKQLSNSQIKKIANYKPEESKTEDPKEDKLINNRRIENLALAHYNLISNHRDKLGSNEINNILDNNEKVENNLKESGTHVSDDIVSPISAISNSKDIKLTPEHIERIKKSIHESSPDITGESRSDFNFRNYLGINPEDSKEVVNKKLTDAMNLDDKNHRNRKIKEVALSHPNITENHISQALDGHQDVAYSAMLSKNVTPANISKALTSRHNLVQIAAADHQNNNSHTINQALDHEDSLIRYHAARNEKATPSNISKALKDTDPSIRIAATRNKNNNEKTINQALDLPDRLERLNAIKNEKATGSNITKALNDPDEEIKMRALLHPNTPPEIRTNAIKNLDEKGLKFIANNMSGGEKEKLSKELVNNPKTPATALNSIAWANMTNKDLLKQISRHPKVDANTLHQLSKWTIDATDKDKDLAKSILKNNKTADYTLQHLKRLHTDPEIQELIHKHPNFKA